jgi:hypothetical protein
LFGSQVHVPEDDKQIWYVMHFGMALCNTIRWLSLMYVYTCRAIARLKWLPRHATSEGGSN